MDIYKENIGNQETFEYWSNEVKRLEGELEIARQKMSSFESQDKKTENQIETKITKYLCGQDGRTFSRAEDVQGSNSFFGLYNENNNVALFRFCGDDAEGIANRVFSSDDICRIVGGGYRNGTSVHTIKPGKIRRVNDGWEVIEPTEVELL